MAIASITKPFSSSIFKLRLPRRIRSKPPSPETTSPSRGGVGEIKKPKSICRDDEFRQVFRFLDADNDGKISAEELRSYFSSIGDSLSHEKAVQIIGELSRGGGDDDTVLLEFGEFVRVVELRGGGDSDGSEVLRQAFGVYEEVKGSGCITAEGLREVLRRLGDVRSVEECKAMIRVYDLDGNGVLDFDEFYQMMMT